jgi:superfamily II DNA or RNA helicase
MTQNEQRPAIGAGRSGCNNLELDTQENSSQPPDNQHPKNVNLRPYQVAVLRRVEFEVAAAHRRVLFVAPTTAGKIVIAASSAQKAMGERRRVLFLALRRELIARPGYRCQKLKRNFSETEPLLKGA